MEGIPTNEEVVPGEDEPTAEVILSPEEKDIKNRLAEIFLERRGLEKRLRVITELESPDVIPVAHKEGEIEEISRKMQTLDEEKASLNERAEELEKASKERREAA